MADEDASEDPVLDVARGDEVLSDHLRDCLRLLRDRSDDDVFRHTVTDVLSGRRGLRDVYGSGEFATELDPLVARFAERYVELTDSERDELAEQGERQLAAERRRRSRD